MSEEKKFNQATCTVHCPSGPTNACDYHAHSIQALMSFMGGHTVRTVLLEPAECDNCRNEGILEGENPDEAA